MSSPWVPIRLAPERRVARLKEFNARAEIHWFGFNGSFVEPDAALITFTKLSTGALGGGGGAAINGGVIAAGFDAAFVLAGLGQYDVDVVVTLELSVKFLRLALVSDSLAFQARVVKSARNFSFVEAALVDRASQEAQSLAIATGMVAPAK